MTKTAASDAELLKRAYSVKTREEMKQLYHDWAHSYDHTMVDGLTYNAPVKTADALARHLDDRKALVADIGCGTGLTGAGLAAHGFSRLHGLDFCDEMLAEARARGIYEKLINVDLTTPLDIETASYDAAISSGLFTHGHLDAACLDEILRIIRPGGLFSCVVRVQVWEPNGFADKFASLEADGAIEMIERRLDTNYEKSTEPDGWYLVMRRT